MIEEKFVDDAHKFNLENISRDFTLKELALLILLGTEQSLSTYNLFYFDLIKEADTLADEFPVHFEINYYEYHLSALDSNYKLTSNSKYSLLKHLGEYAKHAENYKNILDAYEYIYIYI